MVYVEKYLVPVLMTVAAVVLLFLSAVASPPETSSEFADWAQVVGTILGVVGAVFAGYLHSDRQTRIAEAQRFKAAYLLARAAGTPVVDAERWLRGGAAPDEDRLAKDWKRVRDHREAWHAWIPERYEGYLESLSKLEIVTLADAAFLDNLLSVRSRLKWLKEKVSPSIGHKSLDKEVERRLSWAARDVIDSLVIMRRRADDALKRAGLNPISAVEAPPFPATLPTAYLSAIDNGRWAKQLELA